MRRLLRSLATRYALLIAVCVFMIDFGADQLFDNEASLVLLHLVLAALIGTLAFLLIQKALDTRSELRENLEQRRLLETLFEADPDGLAVVAGADLTFRLVNTAYRAMLPVGAVEVLGRGYTEVWHDAAAEQRVALIRRVLETGEPADELCQERIYPDGSLRYFDFRARPLAWAGHKAVLAITRDNTAAAEAQRREAVANRQAQHWAHELKAIFDAMVEGVVVYEAGGTVMRANSTAEDMLGAPAESATLAQVAERLSIRYPNGDAVPVDQMPSSRALRGETVRSERLLLTDAHGRETAILASATPLYLGDRVNAAVAVFHDVTDLEQANERAGKLAALEERQRLARELHDSVSQALYGIALGANSALASLPEEGGRAREALEYVTGLASMALTEMRALIFDLRPESLQLEGLVAGLGRQAAALRARYEVDLQVELCAEPAVALPAKEAAYRIAREAMLNAVKHANASHICLRLEDCGATLEIAVEDDGRGFDPAGPFPGHLGLRSMYERAAHEGGLLRIDSAPGRGTSVRASIPRA